VRIPWVLLFVGGRILIAQETNCPERYTGGLLPDEMIFSVKPFEFFAVPLL
jgi:hypothetical protein